MKITLAEASSRLVEDVLVTLCESIEDSDTPPPPELTIGQAAILLVAGQVMRLVADYGGPRGVEWLLGMLQDTARDPTLYERVSNETRH